MWCNVTSFTTQKQPPLSQQQKGEKIGGHPLASDSVQVTRVLPDIGFFRRRLTPNGIALFPEPLLLFSSHADMKPIPINGCHTEHPNARKPWAIVIAVPQELAAISD